MPADEVLCILLRHQLFARSTHPTVTTLLHYSEELKGLRLKSRSCIGRKWMKKMGVMVCMRISCNACFGKTDNDTDDESTRTVCEVLNPNDDPLKIKKIEHRGISP